MNSLLLIITISMKLLKIFRVQKLLFGNVENVPRVLYIGIKEMDGKDVEP